MKNKEQIQHKIEVIRGITNGALNAIYFLEQGQTTEEKAKEEIKSYLRLLDIFKNDISELLKED